jgi:ribosome-associated toxin RatA of RatAB toxin-antitoxin module
MPTYEDSRQVEVQARPEDLFAVLTDYDHLPDWQSRICECRVLERDEQGRGTIVEYAIDAKLRKVRYRLRHFYDEPTSIGSQYLEGDFKDFAGDYRFTPHNGVTEVEFTLRIDPGFSVPGRIARMLGQAVMGRSLKDLKAHVEEVAGGAQ